MKSILIIVFAALIGFIIYGYYENSVVEESGEKFIGIGVLIFAFIFMPLFIYHRYKGKDLSKYRLTFDSDKDEDN
ncbi:MAG: hypothetical protein ABFR05_13125 [Bacteroidota bacterium]